MEVCYPKCAGLDVHKDTVVACVRVHGKKIEPAVRTFGTTTAELEKLAEHLAEHGVTHVAMEATGCYWKPVWTVLAADFELILANAAHIKNVAGRKTDVKDSAWIADLLAHGLISASFVPPSDIQALRDLTRTRKQLTRERAAHVQRIDKVLQTANVKLSSVITDITGQSGRAILNALVRGETDPKALARLVHRNVQASPEKIAEAVHGRVDKNHRFLLKLHLDQIDGIEQALEQIDARILELMEPLEQATKTLVSIPGVSRLSATVIISEIGTDMSRFPTAGHLISWAGLCPKNDESAGKHRSRSLRKGAPWLKTTLVQCAWAAARSKNTYLRSLFFRLKSRRGPRKAIMAVASSMLKSIYHMLKNNVAYQDLGPEHFDKVDKMRKADRLVRQLSQLGFDVQLKDKTAA